MNIKEFSSIFRSKYFFWLSGLILLKYLIQFEKDFSLLINIGQRCWSFIFVLLLDDLDIVVWNLPIVIFIRQHRDILLSHSIKPLDIWRLAAFLFSQGGWSSWRSLDNFNGLTTDFQSVWRVISAIELLKMRVHALIFIFKRHVGEGVAHVLDNDLLERSLAPLAICLRDRI